MSRQTYLREIYRTALILTECGWLQAKTHVSHVLSQTIFTLTRWHLSASPWQLFPLLSSWQVSIKDHSEHKRSNKWQCSILLAPYWCSIPQSTQRYPSHFSHIAPLYIGTMYVQATAAAGNFLTFSLIEATGHTTCSKSLQRDRCNLPTEATHTTNAQMPQSNKQCSWSCYKM